MYRTVFWTLGEGGGCDLGEWHWNMYIIICEMNRQSRFDAWYRVLRAGALGWPRGMGWGGRWEGGNGYTPMAGSYQCMAKPIQYYNSIIIMVVNSVVSDSFWLHGMQHAKLPCPSLSPRVCSNSCPLSWWCHPTISSSVASFSCPQSFPSPQFESISSLMFSLFMVQFSHPYMTTRKTIALTIWTFVSKAVSLLLTV